MSEILRERVRIAAHKSHGKADDDPQVIQARQNLAALQLERAIQKALTDWPPPTDQQLQRIAALLRAGGGASPPTDRKAVVESRLAELDGGAV